MADPVSDFEHDHLAFSQAVAHVKALLLAESSGDVSSHLRLLRTVDALREDLLVHFAREEEGLFPFLVRVLPDTAEGVERLLSGHDLVCGSLVRLAHSVNRSTAVHGEASSVLFDRFERAYVEHARAEVSLLRSVGTRLAPGQRTELAALLSGI